MASSNTSKAKPTAHLIDFQNSPMASSFPPNQPQPFALIIDNFYTPEECAALLAEATSHGTWETAKVNTGYGTQTLATDVRNSKRILYHDSKHAAELFERVKPFLEQFGVDELKKGQTNHSAVHDNDWRKHLIRDGAKGWKATGLNDLLRFLKYQPGQYFRPHFDGTYETPDGKQRSFFTFHLYLGGTTSSGATRFWGTTRYGDMSSDFIDVEPKEGRVLIFQHKGLLHEGQELKDGEKFTMRTDIMFERVEASFEEINPI